MKTIVNALSLAVSLCLISGQVMAETGQPLASSNYRDIQAYKFQVPASVTSKAPQYTVKQIFERSKSGDYKSRSRLGGMDAGGGKILLCPTSSGVKAKVLDVYEGESANLEMDLGNGKTIDEKIKYVLGRLARVAPYRARAYAAMTQDLLKRDSAFFSDAVMPVTDDLGVTVLPAKCELVQVVVQRNDDDANIPGFTRYLIDRDVFAQLDLDSQAALVLHEVIYREARARGETTSLHARYLNYLVLSTRMETITIEQFNQILSSMKSDCLEKVGVPGQYRCPGLPEVFAEQSVAWKGISFKGSLSVASNSDESFIAVKVSSPVVDLTENAKLFAPATPFSIKIYRGQNNIELSSQGGGLSTSDGERVEAVSSRTKVAGRCLVSFGEMFGHRLSLYCVSDVSITTSAGTRKMGLGEGKGFFIFLKDSGDIETRN